MKVTYAFLILLCFSVLNGAPVPDDSLIYQKPFNKVVLWGHPLYTHTHAWIHWAFARAFKYLGYETLWLDDSMNVHHIDFSNSLFITEGQVDKKIPLRHDCRYILHNCYSDKYDYLYEQGRAITLQVYTYKCEKGNVEKIDDATFVDRENKIIYMPWATDLLPHEIEENKKEVLSVNRRREVNWVGTIGGQKFGNINQIEPFKKQCTRSGVRLRHHENIDMETNKYLIKHSLLAPAIVGDWQKKEGYIPCRIFKNISYGHIGVTNSKAVYDLFKHKIVYNPDTSKLFEDAIIRLNKTSPEEVFEQMDMVRDNHTYLNRIHYLFKFMNEILPFEAN